MPITCKSGGTSVADVNQIRKTIAIIRQNDNRQHLVVSAPGKRHKDDKKITDQLYAWHSVEEAGMPSAEIRKAIEYRYLAIVRELRLELNLSAEFDIIAENLSKGATRDYAASRGEYLMGLIMANVLGFAFVDPMTCVRIDKNGQPNPFMTYDLTARAVAQVGGRVVMPGFYGADLSGKVIKTFSRGGSDISGAILARATNAERYEIWTDVDGMLAADPAVIDSPYRISQLTYREARELSYMGFEVVHPAALFPLQSMGTPIPTYILNTNNPGGEGTHIIPDSESSTRPGQIVGIAGRKNFSVIHLDKPLMNLDIGFGWRALGVLVRHNVSFDLLPGSIDTIDIAIDQAQLGNGTLETMVEEIRHECEGAECRVCGNLALIAFVGNGMVHAIGTAARILGAIAKAGINDRILNQGLSERNIIVGVDNADYERVIQAAYQEFFGQPQPV